MKFESPHLHHWGLVTDQALCLPKGSHRATGRAFGPGGRAPPERGAVAVQGDRGRLVAQVLMDAVADAFTDSVLAKQAPSAESPGRP